MTGRYSVEADAANAPPTKLWTLGDEFGTVSVGIAVGVAIAGILLDEH